MHRVSLSLVIHNHQPVGNFDEVFAKATDAAYEPMIAALERHPKVRLALHYTGPLLDWLRAHRRELLRRVRSLVGRGQVEMLTGGYYEPVLAIIPDADRRGQIEKLTRAVSDEFGTAAEGLWLAERVWEPQLARSIGETGVRYVIVDDTHFQAVGLEDRQLFGYYLTEDQGVPLAVFPSLRKLRYLIPWAAPEEVIAYLRSLADEDVRTEGRVAPLDLALMGDDGEKFGLWPTTYALCWERRWVDRFFAALEAEPWLDLVTPGEYRRANTAAGRIYLPTGTYDEMAQWALPPAQATRLEAFRRELDEGGRSELTPLLRGGFWRHFLVKYAEVNTMHHLSLRASRKVHAMSPGAERARARDALWAGQCNCPYWHGVFGGVYLPHIRGAAFSHLITAEALADGAAHPEPYADSETEDLDGDGRPDVRLATDVAVCTVSPARGGSVVEWHDRPSRRHLGNVLTRRPEAYHAALRDARTEDGAAHDRAEGGAPEPGDTVVPPLAQADLMRWFAYDRVRRPTLRVHLLHPGVTPEQLARDEQDERGEFAWGDYAARVERTPTAIRALLTRRALLADGECVIERTIEAAAGHRGLMHTTRVRWTGKTPLNAVLDEEWNLGVFGVPEDVTLNAGEGPQSLHEVTAYERCERVEVAEHHSGLTIAFVPSEPPAVWALPLFTISNSESGIEKNFQGTMLHLRWPLAIRPGEEWEQTTVAEVTGAESPSPS